MTNLKRKLLAAMIACFVSAGAFAQKKGDRRPPKPQDNKVVHQPKEKPPQNNQGDKRGDRKKGKP